MKKLLCTLSAMTIACVVQAETSPYVSIGGGYAGLFDSDISWSGGGGELEYDPGYVIEGAAGMEFDTVSVRAELAISYQENDGDTFTEGGVSMDASDVTVSALAFMLNGYYDIQTESAITPYVLAGFGFIRADLDTGDIDESDTVLAGQVGAGVGYAVSDGVTIDLKYKLVTSQDIEFKDEDGKNEVENMGHQIQLGVRVML